MNAEHNLHCTPTDYLIAKVTKALQKHDGWRVEHSGVKIVSLSLPRPLIAATDTHRPSHLGRW